MRRTAAAILAVLTILGLTAAPAAATTIASPGAPCDSQDLGRRSGWVESTVVEPAITHFKQFFVTAGTTGTQTVQMTFQEQLTVTVLQETTISVGFSIPLLTKAEANAHFALTKATASTTTEQRTLTWNFNQPGFYGVFSGMSKVTGTMTALQCDRVQRSDGTWTLQWARRQAGSYVSWGRDIEGVVQCSDAVPANSVLRLAQVELGCDGLAAQKANAAARQARTAAKARAAAINAVPAPSAAPSGYVCDAPYYKIVALNGYVWDADDGRGKISVVWATNTSKQQSQQWALCTAAADATGLAPSVIVSRGYGTCLGVSPSTTVTEGSVLALSACESIPSRQKLYVHRDVPGSSLIGIQAAFRGAMAGQDSLDRGQQIKQSEAGMPDGTGTYTLLVS